MPFQQVSTLNGSSVAPASASVSNQALVISGLALPIPVVDIVKVSRTAYAAGTKSKRTVTPGSTILDSTQYSITVKRPNNVANNGFGTDPKFIPKTYTVYSGISDSATTFLNRVRAEIAADLQAYVTATGTTTLILEMNDTDSDFTIDLSAFVLSSTQASTTAYVEPSGTFAIVKALDPNNASSAGQYTTYQIDYNRSFRSQDGNIVRNAQRAIVFADELATLYADFNAKMNTEINQYALNNLEQFGMPVPVPSVTAINSTATATAAQMLAGTITSTSGAATAITTPTAAAIYALIAGAKQGVSFDLIIDNTGGSNTVTLTLDATITVAKQTSNGDSAVNQLLTVASGAAGVGIFRFVFNSATAATCHRIG